MPAIVSPRFLINYFADKQFCQKVRTFRVFVFTVINRYPASSPVKNATFASKSCIFASPLPNFPKPARSFSSAKRAPAIKHGTARQSRAVPQLVDKHSPYDKQFIYAGGARGGKARLESDQMSRKALPCKACVERSDYFRAARRHKNNDIISGCRKKPEAFSTA